MSDEEGSKPHRGIPMASASLVQSERCHPERSEGSTYPRMMSLINERILHFVQNDPPRTVDLRGRQRYFIKAHVSRVVPADKVRGAA
jgi:hypothetical protein